MTLYIKIENKESVDWLCSLIQNTLAQRSHPTTISCYPMLADWENGLSNPLDLKKILEEADALPKPTPKARAKRSTKKKREGLPPEDKANPLICNEHPKYGGVRRPQSNCEGCWSVYQKLHPLEYKQKRRDWERSQKSMSAGG